MLYTFQLSATDSGLEYEVELEPDRRLYCFVGENGVGKTALLESLAQVIWWRHAIFRGQTVSGSSFRGWKQQQPFREHFEKLALRVPHVKVEGASLKAPEDWAYSSALEIRDSDAGPVIDRPFVVVPASARASIDAIGPAALTLVGDKISTFLSAIDRGIDATRREPIATNSVAMWIASRLLVNPNFVVGLRNTQDEVVTLLELLQRFDPAHFGELVKRHETGATLQIIFNNGKLLFLGRPIERLASGYAAILKIMQEVIASISAWEGIRNSTDILGSDALVFIDEIDAHLHPKWQKNLLGFLKREFPKATFVVTTHSALMVRDTEPGEAYELIKVGKRVTSRKLGSPRDWYFSDLLTDAFHVDVPPPGTESSPSTPSLVDQLLSFASLVKEHSASKDAGKRMAALELFESIAPRLLSDDPRKRSLEEMRALLG